MVQCAFGMTAFVTTNTLVYLIKSQTPGLSKVAFILLAIILCANLLATMMPGLPTQLWGYEMSKVSALSIGLWFCLAAGIAVGIAP